MSSAKETGTKDIQDRMIAHEEAYKTLYHGIITGQFEPGKAVTIRGLAEQLGCSTMPVREAVRRLVGLGALEMLSTRRIMVAPLSEKQFQEIWSARALLEPEAAARALPNCDKALINKLEKIDNELSAAIKGGDADSYSLKNWEFHFTLYRASGCNVFLRLIESLWLQFGPFMRMVIGRLGTTYLIDQHQKSIQALRKKDEQALREAVKLDIQDGMLRIEASFGKD